MTDKIKPIFFRLTILLTYSLYFLACGGKEFKKDQETPPSDPVVQIVKETVEAKKIDEPQIFESDEIIIEEDFILNKDTIFSAKNIIVRNNPSIYLNGHEFILEGGFLEITGSLNIFSFKDYDDIRCGIDGSHGSNVYVKTIRNKGTLNVDLKGQSTKGFCKVNFSQDEHLKYRSLKPLNGGNAGRIIFFLDSSLGDLKVNLSDKVSVGTNKTKITYMGRSRVVEKGEGGTKTSECFQDKGEEKCLDVVPYSAPNKTTRKTIRGLSLSKSEYIYADEIVISSDINIGKHDLVLEAKKVIFQNHITVHGFRSNTVASCGNHGRSSGSLTILADEISGKSPLLSLMGESASSVCEARCKVVDICRLSKDYPFYHFVRPEIKEFIRKSKVSLNGGHSGDLVLLKGSKLKTNFRFSNEKARGSRLTYVRIMFIQNGGTMKFPMVRKEYHDNPPGIFGRASRRLTFHNGVIR